MEEEKKKEHEEKAANAEKSSELSSDNTKETQNSEETKTKESEDVSKEVKTETKTPVEETKKEEVQEKSNHEHKHHEKKHEKKHEHKPEHKHHPKEVHHKKRTTSENNYLWPLVSAVLFILLVISIFANPLGGTSATEKIGESEAKRLAQEFVNTKLLQPGTAATVSDINEENGVYKVQLTIQGQQYDSQMTTDGKIFFPQAGIPMDDVAIQQPTGETTSPSVPTVTKAETPEVELFVMSHCPFGTQIEKGILPVVELLGDKANIQVKFVNYAMHGKEEVDEQLTQYCIQQEYENDYYAYLQCFLADSDGAACKKQMGFDETKLQTCIDAADKEFGISADFADKASWSGGRFPKFAIYDSENKAYGVQGSPTLVINGEQVSTGRDSESLKQAICASFTTTPEECATALATATPSAGFGFGTSGTDSAAANCVV
ncbi:hypothetical protein K9L67_01895 [Candidatus Woesearchaeota archaeon]|nr:hypothetical protein [Candidatus Woesearchaeota archaeon]MCF7900956.1 hypothetical protein [Candidatus Woesearchaeota archaeon]MCF8013598.1 hypothetical protein [Candidatus Woesearchaeota archaeon]